MQTGDPNPKAYRIEMEDSLSRIQEVSDRLRVPKHTLRFWEKECQGLFQPLRTQGGQRRYTPEDISIIEEINKLRKRGKSLAELKRTLCSRVNGDNSHSNRIDLLAARVAEIVKAEVNRLLGEVD